MLKFLAFFSIPYLQCYEFCAINSCSKDVSRSIYVRKKVTSFFWLIWHPCHMKSIHETWVHQIQMNFSELFLRHVEKSEQFFIKTSEKKSLNVYCKFMQSIYGEWRKNRARIPAVKNCGKNKKWWCLFVWLRLLLSFHHGNGNGNTRTWIQMGKNQINIISCNTHWMVSDFCGLSPIDIDVSRTQVCTHL